MTVIIRSLASRLVDNWTYTPSKPSPGVRRMRMQHRVLGRRLAPDHVAIKAPFPALRWNVLFLFLPTGNLNADQKKTIVRLRRLAGKLLIVYATPSPGRPYLVDLDVADALIWKDLPGFDFSAYAIALDAIAQQSPGATVYVQNDSVLGPFADIDAAVRAACWDLTGFIASPAIENHISSFAFVLRDVTPGRVAALSPAISSRWSYNDFNPVVLCQESLFARAAARTMTVGSWLYMPVSPQPKPLHLRFLHRARPSLAARVLVDLSADPTLGTPLDLLDRGFPFLKRSLFGKFEALGDQPALLSRLEELDW